MRWGAIITIGILIAAIIRASGKVADQFGHDVSDDPRPASLITDSASFHNRNV